ncbi:Tripeptidyl-peptidase sed4 [Penicillium rolfsii]|nr:Tripeptidyl-peptidase sed4 [Penicillium rolfsii]
MHSNVYAGLLCALAGQSMAVVWESLAGGVPSTWSLLEKPSADSTMTLSIALTRQNLDQLESKLTKLSTPGQASYGQWLSKDEIDTHFPVVDDAPVLSWLKNAGISSIARNGAVIDFTGTVENINKLLDTTFAYYQSGDSVKLRTVEYSIPSDLTEHIDVISPTVFFGKMRSAVPVPSKSQEIKARKASSTEVSASCQTSITPSCLKEMYNVGDYVPEPSAGSRIGFGSFLNQSASYSDLAKFEQLFDIPSQSFTVELLNGGVNNQSASVSDIGEANLDVQNIVGIAHPLPVHEYITGGVAPFIPDADEPTAASDSNEPYLIYYEYLLSKENSEIPQVISNSYGDDEQTVPEKYARRVCNLIGLNTLRGLTVIHSSGDEGVGSACQASDGVTPQFQPIFPATCPYVTAVGGTSDVSPEVAWNASSGGFSNYFPRAWYQYPAIEYYLDLISDETKEYYGKYTDFEGRGFPDVSAHSLYPDYEVIYAGKQARSGGTSAAAPVFAAIIGLLNDARLRAGKSTLGFLNPFLYAYGHKALNDITGGASYGCGGIDPQSDEPVPGSLIIPGAHWNATEGWDPVTGLGTPDFQKLKKLVLSL